MDYINLYSYVGLNPLNEEDPSGMCPLCVSAAVGAATSAAIEIGGQMLENHGKVSDWGAVGKEALIGGAAGATGFGASKLVSGALTKAVVSGAATSGSQDAIKQISSGKKVDLKQVAVSASIGGVTGAAANKGANAAKQITKTNYANSAPKGFTKGSLAQKLAQNGVITKPPHSNVGKNQAAVTFFGISVTPDAGNRLNQNKCNTSWFGAKKC